MVDSSTHFHYSGGYKFSENVYIYLKVALKATGIYCMFKQGVPPHCLKLLALTL